MERKIIVEIIIIFIYITNLKYIYYELPTIWYTSNYSFFNEYFKGSINFKQWEVQLLKQFVHLNITFEEENQNKKRKREK